MISKHLLKWLPVPPHRCPAHSTLHLTKSTSPMRLAHCKATISTTYDDPIPPKSNTFNIRQKEETTCFGKKKAHAWIEKSGFKRYCRFWILKRGFIALLQSRGRENVSSAIDFQRWCSRGECFAALSFHSIHLVRFSKSDSRCV